MWVFLDSVLRTIKSRAWCVVIVCAVIIVMETAALNGDNVCMVKQKYNITKRVKYRAPMSVRTYEWCFSMPPRCSKWNTEMRDLTRLETEERTAEVAVCCPGYKMRDVSCVPICPNGKTGPGCSEDCPDNKWGPNCIHVCKRCRNGFCSPITGECECLDGWQGESCDARMPHTTATTLLEELLTTTTKPTTPARPRVTPSRTTKMTPTTVASPSTTVATPSTTVTSPRTTVTTRKTVATTPKIVTTSTIATTTLKTTVSPTTTTSPVTEPTSTAVTSPSTNTTFTTTTILSTSSSTTRPTSDEEEKTQEKIPYPVTEYDNTTFVTTSTTKTSESTVEAVTQRISIKPSYNTTEAMQTTTELVVVIKAVPTDTVNAQQKPAEVTTTTEIPTTLPIPTETIMKIETTKKETAVRIQPTTVKFKPKEIWIRPAQKGESPIVETKIKTTHEFPRYRSANNKELTPAITTPKTIIVSIIPTSVSYTTFKKIALTSSLTSTKSSTATQSFNKTENEFTKPMLTETSTPPVKLSPISRKDLLATSYFINKTLVPSTSVTPKTTSSTKLTTLVTKPLEVTKTIPRINRTNSMTTDINKNVSTHVTTTSLNARTALKSNESLTTSTSTTRSSITTTATQTTTEQTTKHIIKYVTSKKVYVAPVTKKYQPTNPPIAEKESKKANVTKSIKKVTTEGPSDDEEFHILTEPEHITAVMGDKGTERSTIDLISVISIAGGVMMAVITVAVVIVMIERCRKPRYEDVRKINDIRMRVMIDNNDVPPPYVRSIFHTPLPDPPTLEKCHYQPISTLDRNLKQFMRPVVVQTISPIMLENFRGILECHYDHLPRRSHDYSTMETLSTTPSMSDGSELRHLRASVTDSTIEAMKCEAKLDVIDNTTSEPLYAEIPCWRPPSEHAIEIMNLNGEAVTEL
nr:mucin-2 [Helicoverpa armigera]